MLSTSDTNIQEVSTLILNNGHDVAFLVPTETGLKKSILDAHKSIRAFLKRTQLHDYDSQRQGLKHYITAKFITADEVLEKKVSLYRPESKSGDPRIWVYGLQQLAQAGNLLAFIVFNQELYIINCSRENDLRYALQTTLPLRQATNSQFATELLHKLSIISHKGFIPTVTAGDTGVGMTLENELGISANSSKSPDYKGIELKATRVDTKGKQKNKSQLFSKIPKWQLSPIGSAKALINKRGYLDSDGAKALRHTISGIKPNSLGLFFDIDYANEYLRQMFKDEKFNIEHDTTWLLSDLKDALKKKHKETFWVKAQHNSNRAAEEFRYVEVEHTSNPLIDKLETLIETGIITMDYTMHIKETGDVRDHGYLFKLKKDSKAALFPSSTIHDLTLPIF